MIDRNNDTDNHSCGDRQIDEKTGWIVVNTHPSKEALAIQHLQFQDFDVYCPMNLRRIRHARRAYDARRPLFPSYVFVRYASLERRWRKIMSTFGVRTVIRNGELPSLLSGSFVESLKAREVEGVVSKPAAPFEKGQQVMVCGGALDGLVGEILDMRSSDRIVLLMQLLNQPTRAIVSSNQLRASA